MSHSTLCVQNTCQLLQKSIFIFLILWHEICFITHKHNFVLWNETWNIYSNLCVHPSQMSLNNTLTLIYLREQIQWRNETTPQPKKVTCQVLSKTARVLLLLLVLCSFSHLLSSACKHLCPVLTVCFSESLSQSTQSCSWCLWGHGLFMGYGGRWRSPIVWFISQWAWQNRLHQVNRKKKAIRGSWQWVIAGDWR